MSVSDEDYPKIDISFLCEQIEASGKIEGKEVIGSTVIYVLAGSSHPHKRTYYLRPDASDTINYNRASAIAYRLKFLDELVEWCQTNKDWNIG